MKSTSYLKLFGFANTSLNTSGLRLYSGVKSGLNRGHRYFIYCLMPKRNFLIIICSPKFGFFVFISWSWESYTRKHGVGTRQLVIIWDLAWKQSKQKKTWGEAVVTRYSGVDSKSANTQRKKRKACSPNIRTFSVIITETECKAQHINEFNYVKKLNYICYTQVGLSWSSSFSITTLVDFRLLSQFSPSSFLSCFLPVVTRKAREVQWGRWTISQTA